MTNKYWPPHSVRVLSITLISISSNGIRTAFSAGCSWCASNFFYADKSVIYIYIFVYPSNFRFRETRKKGYRLFSIRMRAAICIALECCPVGRFPRTITYAEYILCVMHGPFIGKDMRIYRSSDLPIYSLLFFSSFSRSAHIDIYRCQLNESMNWCTMFVGCHRRTRRPAGQMQWPKNTLGLIESDCGADNAADIHQNNGE